MKFVLKNFSFLIAPGVHAIAVDIEPSPEAPCDNNPILQKQNLHGGENYLIMTHSNIYRSRHLVTKNIYQISKFNSCSRPTLTTLQGLTTTSEVFAGFNIIVTGLVCCLINASECMQNAPLRRRKLKIFWGGAHPLPKPYGA